MTDRQFTNPLKGTVSPLVKSVPALCRRPQRLDAKSKFGNVIPISNYTNIWKEKKKKEMKRRGSLPLQWMLQKTDSTWCRKLKWNGHLSSAAFLAFYNFFMSMCHLLIFQCVPPFLYYSKTSAVWNSNVWSSITSQTQSACEIALSNLARCCSAQWSCRSALSLVESLVHRRFQTDFYKLFRF